MRSPRYRSITGRSVRLPLLLVAAMTAMTVGMSTLTGWMLGSAAGSPSDQVAPPVTAMVASAGPETSPAVGIAVTALTITAGVDEPIPLAIGERAGLRAVAALADGTSREDAPVRWSVTDDEVLSVDPTGVVTGRTPGQARVHAVLPPFDASVAVVVGGAETVAPGQAVAQPDPDELVRQEQRLLDWVTWVREQLGLPAVAVDDPRCGAVRTLVAHALRQGGMDQVRPQARQLRAAEAGGWAVRLWPVGLPAAWHEAGFDDVSTLMGDEARSFLTDPSVAQVAVGLVFDGRASDQLWAGVAVKRRAP
ncbi:MAG: hypothetical protein OXG33_15120 [Chloroflexi bacterium]|nr:hypothetical protein [Chloroflexota bacterium]